MGKFEEEIETLRKYQAAAIRVHNQITNEMMASGRTGKGTEEDPAVEVPRLPDDWSQLAKTHVKKALVALVGELALTKLDEKGIVIDVSSTDFHLRVPTEPTEIMRDIIGPLKAAGAWKSVSFGDHNGPFVGIDMMTLIDAAQRKTVEENLAELVLDQRSKEQITYEYAESMAPSHREKLTALVIADLTTLMGEAYMTKAQADGLVIVANPCNYNGFDISIPDMTGMDEKPFEIETLIEPKTALKRIGKGTRQGQLHSITFSTNALYQAVEAQKAHSPTSQKTFKYLPF